jgi:hypothetical protein
MSEIGRDSFSGGFLVYINGVRVPASSANVSVQVDSPASASIQLPAHPILYGVGDEDLLDLAIFYLDNYQYTEPKWCLLFEGRITGQGYSNTPSNESMYFTAESNMNALQDLYLNFVRKGKGKVTSNKSYPNQIDIRGKSYKSFLSESLSGRPLARPFDLVDNIYFSVLGSSTAKVESRLDTLASKSVDSLIDKKFQALSSTFETKANRLITNKNLSAEERKVQVEIMTESLKKEWIAERFGDRYTNSLDVEIKRQLREEVKASSQKGSPTVTTGFFARYFRKIRSRNHWVCSPYLEGIPNSDNPIKAHIGGGVFPLFKAAKSKRYAKSMAKSSGAMYGPGGSALATVKNIFSLYYYRMTEVLAPPAYTVDKYGLPKNTFNSGGSRDNYMAWSSNLSKSKDRLCIASYLTHPVAPFSIPPACNAIFPSMRFSFNCNNGYSGKPTRLYFDKKSPYGRLNFKVNSASYATDSSRVTFPSVIAGAAQRAAGKASEEIDLLVFPEEYYRGPRPVSGQMHPTYLDLKKYASASRFGTEDRGDPIIPIPSVEGMSPEEAISSLESVEKAHKKGISSYGLYFLLARKQYLSQKYGAVSGDVSMMFNPYIICGFPCAILGGEKSGLHFYGEVASVNHSLSSNGHTTSIQVGTLRTINSVIQGIVADGFPVDSYPQEPVEEIRDLLQVYEQANEYYSQVLKKDKIGTVSAKELEAAIEYKKLQETLEEKKDHKDGFVEWYGALIPKIEQLSDKLKEMELEISSLESEIFKLESKVTEISKINLGLPAAFDFKSFLGWQSSENPNSIDYIVVNELDKDRRKVTDPTGKRTSRAGYRTDKLVPLPETKSYFESSSKAMKLVSRPVCTLEQYIDFYSCVDLDKAISSTEGRGRGCRLGERRDHFSGALYYDVIRQYIGGPGIEPGTSLSQKSSDLLRRAELLSKSSRSDLTEKQLNYLTSKIEELRSGNALTLTGIGPSGEKVFARFKSSDTMTFKDLPDSRKDWQKLLLDYVTIIEGKKPVTSEG